MYKSDHIKVLKVLGTDAPKRTQYKVSEIVAAGFKSAENADRRVRNAMRKLRGDEVVEICERGEYRLTQLGASAVQKWVKEGWPTKERAHTEKERKQPTKKAKSAVKAKAKKAPTKAKPKKVAKAKAPAKAKKKAPKKIDLKKATSKAPAKTEKPAAKTDNGASAKTAEKAKEASASQLAF